MPNAEARPLEPRSLEPWLRGTRLDIAPLPRAVLHAFDLTRDDFDRWVWPLDPEQLEATPFGLPSVAFQARHLVRSLDRLLTYAAGEALSVEQHRLLQSEHTPADLTATRREFEDGLEHAEHRLLAIANTSLDAPRHVGRDRLPVTFAGLLVHLADHTQRHAGQAVTTAKVLRALHDATQS